MIDHRPWHFHFFRRHHTAVNGKRAQDADDGDDKPRLVNRHIILIRHGQYNMEGASDKERALTELGQFVSDYSGGDILLQNFKNFVHYWANKPLH